MSEEADKEQQITLVDEHGNEELYNVLFTFDSEDYGKSYMFCIHLTQRTMQK